MEVNLKRLQTIWLSGKGKTMKAVKINGCKVSGRSRWGEAETRGFLAQCNCNPWGRKESDTTERLNWLNWLTDWTELNCSVWSRWIYIMHLSKSIKCTRPRANGLGFPDCSVVKNPPANAGGTGSITNPGGSHMPWSTWAHAPQLLSLCSRALEPQLLKPSNPRACAPQQEKCLD